MLGACQATFFTNINTGYAVSDLGAILNTTNGGTDWTIQKSWTENFLNSIYFTDTKTGYTVGWGGTILKTTNGVYPIGMNDKPAPSDALKIYPNPTDNKITVETSAMPTQSSLSIQNLNGQEILTRQITEPKTQIDISALPAGIYIAKIIGVNGVQVGKFIKQ